MNRMSNTNSSNDDAFTKDTVRDEGRNNYKNDDDDGVTHTPPSSAANNHPVASTAIPTLEHRFKNDEPNISAAIFTQGDADKEEFKKEKSKVLLPIIPGAVSVTNGKSSSSGTLHNNVSSRKTGVKLNQYTKRSSTGSETNAQFVHGRSRRSKNSSLESSRNVSTPLQRNDIHVQVELLDDEVSLQPYYMDDGIVPNAVPVNGSSRFIVNAKDDVIVEGHKVPAWYKQTRYMVLLVLCLSVSVGVIVGVVVLMQAFGNSSDTSGDDQQFQRRLLNSFFAACGGDELWINKNYWGSNESICNWYGISCSNGIIYRIDLNSNNLSCDFSSSSRYLSGIETIRSLNLKSNNLHGNITEVTKSLAQIRSILQIDLRFNNFDGAVASELCELGSSSGFDIAMVVLVDCNLSCSCCNQQNMCDCKNADQWTDSSSNRCVW